MAKYQKRYLSSSEVTKVYGISAKMLSGWRQQRVGPPFIQLGERTIRYKIEDLEKWVESRKTITREMGRYW